MKILHIVPSYKPAYIYGGPIESVSKLCEGLALAGHQVDVFTTTANGETELDVEAGIPQMVDGVTVTYFKRITKDPTHISPDLWKHLYANVKNYDIVNIQSWWNILVIIAACICHLKKVKVVVTPRGMLSEYIFESGSSKAKKLIHATIGRSALAKSWFHATAEAEYEECRKIIKDWKGFVQPNIITLPDIPLVKQANNVFTLIFMSRVHPKKGIEILLHALSRLPFEAALKIAGSGEDSYMEELKQLAANLKITEKIEWMGWVDRDHKFKALMDADLFALVSHNENFANVVIESLHMGTPVLVSEEVALSAFVQRKDVGWVSSLDVVDVVEKLTIAKNDREKLERIRATGRAVIEENFSPLKLVNNYVEEYQRVINS
ncbi:XrtY-associated glycosyltransferase XYAG1 [Pedobacter sp. L105]|uniref:XrtY-associated glycosyltransferase XYAG1 n=1 Tax=Pedobacter sp. L105 TaxID=1641871 RepID=UPI00131D7AED|nr:glycosyltransferase [Pedobacter sp. L105]